MIHPRVHLVTAEVVATMRGISGESVYHRVDTGDGWMWVWNVGAARGRELRFWSRELREPAATKSFQLEDVIRQIVPRRELFGSVQKWEVCDLLRVSRYQVSELQLPFVPRAGGMWIATGDLENFFRRRWLFASTRS